MLKKTYTLCAGLTKVKYVWGYEPPCYTHSSQTNSIFIQQANWLQARCSLTQWQWPCTTSFYYICSYLTGISQFNCQAEKSASSILPGGRLIPPTAAKGFFLHISMRHPFHVYKPIRFYIHVCIHVSLILLILYSVYIGYIEGFL